ncbi:MAG TPA: hypothetical protein VGQ30_15375 [Gemmatimonadaceae bacterium]|jgi:hypothetical protein|nr:hypothetical protein [Gemmatimonadaceae bacterium]
MKRALLVCCTGVLVPFAAAVSQGTPPEESASWGIMAGGDFTAGSIYGSSPGSGGAIGVLAHFPVESSHFAIRLDAMLQFVPIHCGSFVVCSPVTPGSATASLIARLNDSSKRWSPYAIAGFAGYLNQYWTAGFAGGGGFEVRSATHTYFLEARYMRMLGGGLVPITLGMRF